MISIRHNLCSKKLTLHKNIILKKFNYEINSKTINIPLKYYIVNKKAYIKSNRNVVYSKLTVIDLMFERKLKSYVLLKKKLRIVDDSHNMIMSILMKMKNTNKTYVLVLPSMYLLYTFNNFGKSSYFFIMFVFNPFPNI